ncbi:hypothetical protein ACQUW5_04750 [Legionella sp. CNM-1927-20]|uniref:hypothetical protein n=1 Tax=Legionella sp. CNM-1927-20 TaxID=3422221 RepID=UPI00403AAE7A
MRSLVALSDHALSYLDQLNLNINFPTLKDNSVATYELLQWLSRKQEVDARQKLLLESFYVAILKDLNKGLSNTKKSKSNKNTSWTAKAKFILLAIAGTIFFGCEGFDGVNAILGATSLPAMASFAIGIVFSLLSIAVFYAFDLLEVSKNLGVDFKSAPKLIDNYLKKVQYIKSIRANLRNNIQYKKTCDEIDADLQLIQLLIQLYNELDNERKALTQALERPALKATKVAAAIITGIIFFSGGFFAGQTVALAIAGLFTAGVAATFWPILVASVFVGLMAFAVYWFVERPGVENLISKWFGLDKEKIDELCNPKLVEKDKTKLNQVEAMLLERREELEKFQKTQQALKVLETQYIELERNFVDIQNQKKPIEFKEEKGDYDLTDSLELSSLYPENLDLVPADHLILPEPLTQGDSDLESKLEQPALYSDGAPRYTLFDTSNSLPKDQTNLLSQVKFARHNETRVFDAGLSN